MLHLAISYAPSAQWDPRTSAFVHAESPFLPPQCHKSDHAIDATKSNNARGILPSITIYIFQAAVLSSTWNLYSLANFGEAYLTPMIYAGIGQHE